MDRPMPAHSTTFRYRWTDVRRYPLDSHIDGRTVHLVHLSLSNNMSAIGALKPPSIYIQTSNMSIQADCSTFGETRSWWSVVTGLCSLSMLHIMPVGNVTSYTFDLDGLAGRFRRVPKDCTVTLPLNMMSPLLLESSLRSIRNHHRRERRDSMPRVNRW